MKMKAEQQQQQQQHEVNQFEDTPYFAGDIELRDEALQEKRRKARELFKEQVTLVENRKREAITKRLEAQRSDELTLVHNRNE